MLIPVELNLQEDLEDGLPYQSSGNRRNSLQFGVGRSIWAGGLPPPILPERVFDGLPGFLAWLSLLLVVAGAVTAPRTVFTLAALIGAYTAARMLLAGIASIRGRRFIRQWEHTDWRAEYGRRRQPDSLDWNDVLHLVVVPNYNEELRVLRQTLDRLAQQSVAREQVAVILAMEGAEGQAASKVETLKAEYSHCFRYLFATLHPRGISGELQVKSSNATWALRTVKRQLVDEMGYDINHIVVTTSDADSLVHAKYLECLTCLFATVSEAKRHLTVWQAPIRYHNNVWTIHPAFGLIHAYSSALELAYMSAPWFQPLPISTYSLSLRLTDEVGYWDPDTIADELHMFLKCFFRRGGEVELGRVFLPFTAYAVAGDNFVDTCKNRYQQSMRHAWGAKELGYCIVQMIEHPEAPFLRGLKMMLDVAHDNVQAGAGWVIMTFGAQLPILLYPALVTNSWQSPPFLLLQISLLIVGILGIVFWILDIRSRPPRPRPWTLKERILTLLSLPMLPFLTLVFLALPVIDAQTRLLLGIPIRFRVARKV